VTANGASSSRDEALAELRAHDRFLLVTHERPDGDAVGSLAAMQRVLAACGKDALAFLAADEFPLPYEYRFIAVDGLVTEPPTPEIADALYVGLVTDTGRFMYETTGPRAHRMAAELIEGGIDVHGIYRRLYEGIPQGKLELLARGLSAVERYDGGLLTLTRLTREDYRSTGADESYSEGVVDHLRSVEGTAVAGLVRDQLGENGSKRKVSLRATDDRVDVSRIARAGGGGGHRRAAGFSTDMEFGELVEFLRGKLAEQL
jgi:nanoRNase/pAp phosphatase (c-di-AMP/oligoRNAs hydrolase)